MFDASQVPFVRRDGHKETIYRHILSAANENFFDSVLVLIDSVFSHSYLEFYQISIYDLGLTDEQRKILNSIPRVKTLQIPNRTIDENYVRDYFFKVDFMYLAQYLTPTNVDKTLYLYLDAGVLVNAPLSHIWREIDNNGYFIADMADRLAWEKTGDKILLFNTFPDDLVDSGLSTDFALLSKPLLRPGIFGYKLHSAFFADVIEQGYKLSRSHPEYLRGEKFTGRAFAERAPLFHSLKDYHDENGVDRCIDDFIGYRHDQFLFSYLFHKSGYAHKCANGLVRDITHAFVSRKNLSGENTQTLSRSEVAKKHKDAFLIHRNTIKNDVDVGKLCNWFHFDNDAVKDKISGKRVAIIGPAKHVYETEAGAKIDNFDFVCRVNKYRKNDKYTKNIGGRCDILVHCISETQETGGPISDVDFSTTDPCIISPYALLDDFEKSSTFQPYYGNLKNFRNYFRKYDYKVFAPPNDQYLLFEKALGSRPNSGFAGIVTLLDFEPKELHVTGFTFFSGGYHTSYRKETEYDVMTKMATSGFHDQQAQLDFFVQRVVHNPRLTMDAPLAEIVNKRLAEMACAPSGKRLVIIGNGPSLKGFNFRTLRNKPTVSFNRAYIIYEEQNFFPVYYFCIDKAVLLNCLKDIESLLDSPIQRFVLLDCPEAKHLAAHDKVTLAQKTPQNSKFFGDVATYALFYLMQKGFKGFDVYGCDCSYIEDINELNVEIEHNDDDPARRIVLKPKKGAIDPNHFLPNYFGEGTEYSVPREDNHYDCWKSIQTMTSDNNVDVCFRTPSKVSHLFSYNPAPDSSPDRFYNNAPIQSQIPPYLFRDIPRSIHAHVDETRVIAHMLNALKGDEHIMVDVGAHHGVTSGLFHDLGWIVYCFEPDPENRKKLQAKYQGADRVIIDPRAVSDNPQTGVSFFTSNESTGISALHAFRETHEVTEKVDVTTISEIVAANKITSIDFLKIDVEGYDFAVLKGVPWDVIQPSVIECEFEDAKTVKLGHSVHDLVAFLEAKGYEVYISEWHPIIRYGIRHDWRRIYAYSKKEDLQPSAWGNLLAFKKDPGIDAMTQAFQTLIKTNPDKTAPKPTVMSQENLTAKPQEDVTAAKPQPTVTEKSAASTLTEPRPFYARYGDKVRTRSPRAFALLRITRRVLAGLWRRRLWTLPSLLMLALIVLLGFTPMFSGIRVLLWGAAAFAAVMFTVAYLGLRIYHIATALGAENIALRNEVSRLKDETRRTTNALKGKQETLHKNAEIHKKDYEAKVKEIKSEAKTLENRLTTATSGQNWVRKNIMQLKNEALTVDLVSAARALRPLWLGGTALDRFNDESQVEHGHAIFMAALVDEERASPGILKGKTLIEVGTTRGLSPIQKSTEKLALFAAFMDIEFVSVDMDPDNTKRVKQILRLINPSAQAITQKGEDYLAEQTGFLDYVYLDAFDLEYEGHTEQVHGRYESLLATEITNEAAWTMHLKCAESIVEKMREGGIVAFDDTWLDDEGKYQGKGKYALPFLLERGFEIIASSKMTYCLKRVQRA